MIIIVSLFTCDLSSSSVSCEVSREERLTLTPGYPRSSSNRPNIFTSSSSLNTQPPSDFLDVAGERIGLIGIAATADVDAIGVDVWTAGPCVTMGEESVVVVGRGEAVRGDTVDSHSGQKAAKLSLRC